MLPLLLVVVFAACGGSLEPIAPQPDEPAAASTPGAEVDEAAAPLENRDTASFEIAPATTRSPVPSLGEVDLVSYIATIEEILRGTSYEGEALEAPSVFLATGALFCDQLDAGASRENVVKSYVETLAGGSVDDATDDDLAMAGAVLGTGLVTLCPHHLRTGEALP